MSTLLNEIFDEMEYADEVDNFEIDNEIDKSSKDFQENYIDNFTSYQMRTKDSTDKDHYFMIFFSNGKSKKFHLSQIPGNMPPVQEYNGMKLYNVYIGAKTPDRYQKDTDGLIYPIVDNKIKINERFTPHLTNLKTKIVLYQQIVKIMTIGAAFGSIISANSGLSGINGGPQLKFNNLKTGGKK